MAILREELEKEEMYVEYLNKLLVEIEEHRKKSLKLEETSLDDILEEQHSLSVDHAISPRSVITIEFVCANFYQVEEGLESDRCLVF